MDKNLDYQEDYQVEYDLLSDIYPFQDKKSCGGRKKSQVWDYFDTDRVRKHGHVGCICKGYGWKRAIGKACEIVNHLRLSCSKASGETKQIFMEEIRNRTALKLDH